jgi:hypothetical protein
LAVSLGPTAFGLELMDLVGANLPRLTVAGLGDALRLPFLADGYLLFGEIPKMVLCRQGQNFQ